MKKRSQTRKGLEITLGVVAVNMRLRFSCGH